MKAAGTLTLMIAAFGARAAGANTSNDVLWTAIEKDDKAAIERAVSAGADVNAKDKAGATPLMLAAVYSDAGLMQLLLDKGADPNGANIFAATALVWSAGDFEKVRLLIEKGADVNAKPQSGRTALMAAASVPGNLETVKLLLKKGADLKARDSFGNGPVLAAASGGDEKILKELVTRGGDPNERGRYGLTPLMLAAQSGRIEPVKVLLDAGAKVNDQSEHRPLVKAGLQELGEQTALLIAAATGNADLVKLLLNSGANVNVRDMRGMTPLMMAASSEFQDRETAQLLLKRGADVSAKSKDGQTAASWAANWGRSGLTMVLGKPEDTPVPTVVKAVGPGYVVSARAAVEKALAVLQPSSTQFFSKGGCVGCHHQMLTGFAVGLARGKGVKLNEALAEEQLKTSVTIRSPEREGLFQGVSRGGAPMVDSLLLASMAAQHYRADRLTTAMAHAIASMQSQDGAWHSHIVRQPIEYSAFSETAYAVRALVAYGPPGRKAEIDHRIERARNWLLSNKAPFHEDRAMRLLGLRWSGASDAAIKSAVVELVATQQTDGGWAQREGFPSDAYATGQALFALHHGAGIRVSDVGYNKGVDFLRRTQLPDGSWYVRSRSLKFQPYFESGFPHEHDQWISAAGSAWAAMALTAAVEPEIASR